MSGGTLSFIGRATRRSYCAQEQNGDREGANARRLREGKEEEELICVSSRVFFACFAPSRSPFIQSLEK
jgi:hypothetical protein